MRLINFFISLFFGATFGLLAQSTESYTKLEYCFSAIQEEYEVDFSYANREVESLYIQEFDYKNDIETTLIELKKRTPFDYQLLTDNIIAVVLKPDYKVYCVSPLNFHNQQPIFQVDFFLGWYKVSNQSRQKAYLPLSKSKIKKVFTKVNQFDNRRFDVDNLKEAECYELYLFPESINLDEVVITDYVTKGIDKMKGGQIRFNPTNFGALPGLIEPDVLQSIQTLPGVMSTEENVSYLNVRGGTHDQNLFLWDGIKMYQTSHFFGMITSLNPYMTQSTEIIKNASNPAFGDGVSSVINMKTDTQINKNLKAEVGANMIHADFFLDAPIQENSSLQISGRQSINQVVETPTYDRFFDKVFQNTSVIANSNSNVIQQNDNFSFYDFSFRWLYQLSEKDFFRVNGLFTNNDFFLTRQELSEQSTSTRESALEQQNTAFGIFYKRDWNNSFNSTIQFYTSNYKLRSENTAINQAQTLIQENQVEEWGIKWNNSYDLTQELKIFGGYQINETGILNFENINDPFFRRSIKEAILTNSIFGGLNFQPSENTLVSVGSRLNHVSKFNSILLEPRLSISQRFLNDFVFEIQAEQKSQTTSQIIDQQSDFLGVESRRWVLANPGEVPIVTSEQISAGLNYKQNSWFITTDFFYKRILNITSQSQGFQNQFQFEATQGNYEVVGAEFLVNKKWNHFSSWLSYTLSENNYYFEAFEPQKFLNNLDITHVVNFGINYTKSRLNLATGIHWHSGLPTTPIIQSEQDGFTFGVPNESRLRDFLRVDFSASYRWFLKDQLKLYAGLSVWNLLGRNNIYNSFFQNPNHALMTQSFQLGLGFTPNFSLRLQF